MKIDALRTVASNYNRCTCLLKRGGISGARVEEGDSNFSGTLLKVCHLFFVCIEDSWKMLPLSLIFTVNILHSMHIIFARNCLYKRLNSEITKQLGNVSTKNCLSRNFVFHLRLSFVTIRTFSTFELSKLL